jgi:hypothetical protein
MKITSNKKACIKQYFRSLTSFTLASFLLILMALQTNPSHAQGNLLITPSRVVFDGTTTSEVINLANTGNDTARYLVSFIQYKMTEDGAFVEIATPEKGQNFASDYVRYFPRNVVLGPKESQVVKVQATKMRQLKPGEYRSHLYFRSVPDQKPLGEEEILTDTTAISVKLTPVFGITIPVIIKVGESTAQVSISDLSFSTMKNRPALTITLSRSGNMSVFGNLAVKYTTPQGETNQVGFVKGVAVYTPNTLRKITIPLTFPDGIDPDGSGKIKVTYTAASDLDDTVLAETDATLGQIQ